MKRAVFTIIAKNYLAQARSLVESVARTSPGLETFVILADEPEGYFDPDAEPFPVIQATDLPLPSPHWFRFQYTPVELATAIKPYAAQFLLDRHGVDRLVYLDPDIRCYRSLDAVFDMLDQANVLLTPHLTAPFDDLCRPNEVDILRLGLFNLGFIAMRRSQATQDLLAWWSERLREHCVISPDQGVFVDQRWLDLAPGMFDGVEIVRDRGWNAAYWDFGARPVRFVDGRPEVDGRPLVFFHFSGYDPRRPDLFSRHQNRFLARDLGEGAALLHDYKEALLTHGFSECSQWPYTWSRFADGTPIPDVVRAVAHESPGITAYVEDPFSEDGKRAIADVWTQPARSPAGEPLPFSHLALRYWEASPHLRNELPDIFGAHAEPFAAWFTGKGRQIHRVPDDFVEPSPLRETDLSDLPPKEWLGALLSTVPGLEWRLRSAARRKPANERTLAQREQTEGWLAPPELLADCLLAARPDLQARALPGGRLDEGWYRAWLLSYGVREYGFPPWLTGALEESWELFLSRSAAPAALRARLHRAALEISARRNAVPARRATRPPRTPPAPHPALVREPAPAARADRSPELGVNLIGQFETPSGIGQAARLSRCALEAAKVPLYTRTVPDNPANRNGDALSIVAGPPPHPFDLVHVNADSFGPAVQAALGPYHDPAATIGYWFWELEEFPEKFDGAFRFCSEVWTATEFCRRAMAARAPTPVVAIPLPIRTEIEAPETREAFSIEPDRFVFLCMADMASVPARKNPLGAIEAFLKAAPAMPGAQLIVKLNNADERDPAMQAIREAAAKGPVRIFAETMPRQRVDSLINCSDCVVSLHRSEGFGLVLAEAMSEGKPVIATAYSGNMDFMDAASAFLVDYELGCVPEHTGPYRPGAVWAEPSLDGAAAQMRKVFSDPASRAAVAEAGRQRVRKQLHPLAVGRKMRARLDILRRRSATAP